LFTCVVVILAGLLARVAFLQLLKGAHYAEEARRNVIREVRVLPPRGRILDRTGSVLAADRPVLTVSLLAGPGAPTPGSLALLSRTVGVGHLEVLAALGRHSGRLFVPVPIASGLDPEAFTILAERALEHPELVLGWEPVREYPLGPAAAHLLGYTGETTPEDLALYPAHYVSGDRRGLGGVEAVCDWFLRGTPTTTVYEVDASGRSAAILVAEAGAAGLDIRLTLDADLQRVAYESLGKSLERVRSPSAGGAAAAGGAVVVLDPATGAVLAMVSLPSFDPNLLSGAEAGEVVAALNRDPGTPFLDRATSGLYATGSTFKVVTAAAALESGVTTGSETIFDGGAHWRIPKKCWRTGGHGRVDLRLALAVSCNVYFYEMGLRLGIDRLAAYARLFGLGEPTGLDLYQPRGAVGPGRSGPDIGRENRGVVPDPDYKASRFPEDPTFWPAEVMDAAIGEGLHAHTPLQTAVLTAALANGGTRWRPYVIDAVLRPDGLVLTETRPEAAGQLGLSDDTVRAVREGMLAAAMETQPLEGTAASVFGPAFKARWGIEVAGKTGTHERGKESGRGNDAWFICYAPYDDPQLAIVVVVEEGESGARAAAPVARAVIEAWLAKRRLDPGP
jgi:penicillin-binding protein 2